MKRLFEIIVGLSIGFAILFYYNMQETKKTDAKMDVIREDKNLQTERFNTQFSTFSMQFAETDEEKSVLKDEINISKNEVKKIVDKRDIADKKLKEAEARSDKEFSEVANFVDNFENDEKPTKIEKINKNEFKDF